MASLDPSTFGNPADIIFMTRSLRPLLYAPHPAGAGNGTFLKPPPPPNLIGKAFAESLAEARLGNSSVASVASSRCSSGKTRRPVSGKVRPASGKESSRCSTRSEVVVLRQSAPKLPFQSDPEESPRISRRAMCGAGVAGLGAPSRTVCLNRLRQLGLSTHVRPLIPSGSSDNEHTPATSPSHNSYASCGSGTESLLAMYGGGATSSSSRSTVKPSRRRLPLVTSFYSDFDDPALIEFPDEPDDDRVRLPAHRIGDPSPEVSPEVEARMNADVVAHRRAQMSKPLKLSKSAPALHIAGATVPRKRPLHEGMMHMAIAELRSHGAYYGEISDDDSCIGGRRQQFVAYAQSEREDVSQRESPTSGGPGYFSGEGSTYGLADDEQHPAREDTRTPPSNASGQEEY